MKLKDYMRPSSGLVREFSTYDVFVFNVLGFSLGVVLAASPTFIGKGFPDANPYWVLILGTGLAVLNGYVYSLFAAAMPRSGGEYEYVGRTFGHRWGFVASWGFSWSQFLGLGAYTAWCVQTSLSPAILNIGYATNRPQWVDAGKAIASPVNTFFVGSSLLLLVFVISAYGLKTVKKFMNIFFWVSLSGTVLMAGLFLSTSHEQFVTLFNGFMERQANYPNAYQRIIDLAHKQGMRTKTSYSLFQTLMALPIGYWMYIGFTYSAYVGGEVKKADRSQIRGIIGALLFGFVFYMIALFGYYNAVGREFNNAISLIQGKGGNPLLVDNGMGSLAGTLTSNIFVNVLMSTAGFLWYLLLLLVMTQVCSRNLFSWSHYKVLPKKIATVSKRSGAPLRSLLIIVFMAIGFLALFLFGNLSFINYIAIFSISFLITGLASLRFASSSNPIFLRAPSTVNRRVFGTYLMRIAGVGNTILFLIVLYSSVTNSGIGGTEGRLPIFILAAIYVAGYVVYDISKWLNKQKGIILNQEMSITISDE